MPLICYCEEVRGLFELLFKIMSEETRHLEEIVQEKYGKNGYIGPIPHYVQTRVSQCINVKRDVL